MSDWPSAEALEELDAKIQRALITGDESELEVLGYGEISAVIALRTDGRAFACKRLPPFPTEQSLRDYETGFASYLKALRSTGVKVVDSELIRVGERILYCVQPLLDPSTLAVHAFRDADASGQAAIFRRIAAQISATVGPKLGLDGQLSNWIIASDGSLEYLDITTPLMRDEVGEERLDTDVFLASLPWLLRGIVRRFMLSSILQTYYEPRSVLVDFLANLHKEKLVGAMPQLLEIAADFLPEPISEREVEKYYSADARTWELLLRLRRADRGWQRTVRRRSYGFLLPGPIAR